MAYHESDQRQGTCNCQSILYFKENTSTSSVKDSQLRLMPTLNKPVILPLID